MQANCLYDGDDDEFCAADGVLRMASMLVSSWEEDEGTASAAKGLISKQKGNTHAVQVLEVLSWAVASTAQIQGLLRIPRPPRWCDFLRIGKQNHLLRSTASSRAQTREQKLPERRR